MIEAIRKGAVRSVVFGVLTNVVLFALLIVLSESTQVASCSGAQFIDKLIAFLHGVSQPLAVFLGGTVLDLHWWATLGLLLAAIVIAHRRHLTPEARQQVREASGGTAGLT